MNRTNEEITNKFIAAYNSFDIDTMLSFVHRDVQFRNISDGIVNEQTVGKKEFEKLARQSAQLFKERRQTVVALSVTEDKVIVEIEYRAVLATDLPDGLKKGDSLDIKGKSEYAFKDGLIFSIIDES